jgi:hypothetical protein
VFRGTRVVLALGLVVLVVGCSSSGVHASGGPTAGAGASCGTTRTGANVPVVIKVAKGDVDCGTALKVENDYATMIKRGELTGNGGGAPLQVDGWTCQGYPTPEVLRTGNASECHSGSSEILAVLNLAASSATTSPTSDPSATAPSSSAPSTTASSATASAG